MMTYKKLHLTTIISMGSEMTKYYGVKATPPGTYENQMAARLN